jgi:large subunit ribosomal protein L10
MTSHARTWKEAKKAEIMELAKKYPVVSIATLEKLPANILSKLRKKLAADGCVRVAKTQVIAKALADAGVVDEKLNSIATKSIVIIFTKKNPFELFSFIKKNKGSTSAKEGDISEIDILVKAGDTGLPPGPALSTLKAAGLQVKMAGPTISISSDKVVTKKGEAVSKEVADVLGKLNIKPMKVGMKILGVLDKTEGIYYSALSLDVDEEELYNKIVLAAQQAFNLAVNAEYYCDETMETIVIKAERAAKAVKDEIAKTTVTE